MMHVARVVAAALLVVAATACGTAADTPDVGPDAGVDDGVPCPRGLPEPSDACLPGCGNEFGVGQTCTKGGYQCPLITTGKEATFCTVDFNDTNLAFCTKPCAVDEDCGTGAVCTGDPANPDSDKGCTPISCAD